MLIINTAPGYYSGQETIQINGTVASTASALEQVRQLLMESDDFFECDHCHDIFPCAFLVRFTHPGTMAGSEIMCPPCTSRALEKMATKAAADVTA